MAADDDPQAELLRQFQAAVSGMELADLRRLAGDLTLLGQQEIPRPERPELRRPARDEPVLYRIRVDLDDARPPIWRRLDLRSDLTLDVVHQVLQAAFDWTDSHLHRFSLGGGPFDRHSQLFLCPYDADEGEDDGEPAASVRLDETLQEPGEVLQYVYDYGDSWELTLRLEELLPLDPAVSTARVVAGRRSAPPEDCGGLRDAADLSEVLDDPERFDLEEANTALQSPYFVLQEAGLDGRLVDILNRLRYSPSGGALVARALTLIPEPTEVSVDERGRALAAFQWFLDHANGDGIELTSAGYLKPAAVVEASVVVPRMAGWIGTHNREAHCGPLLGFREALQSLGLLRKYKGRLVLTRAGAAAQRDSATLWQHLATRLAPRTTGDFQSVATLLTLAYAGSSGDQSLPLAAIGAVMSELGWSHHDGRPISGWEIYQLDVIDVLLNLTEPPFDRDDRERVSPAASALARAALRPSH